MAEVEAEKAAAFSEAELQKEVERKNALAKTEQLRAQLLSKARVAYEIMVCHWSQLHLTNTTSFSKKKNRLFFFYLYISIVYYLVLCV